MEVRADVDVGMGVDVTPRIQPWAHCLDRFFSESNCASCFRALESPEKVLRCNGGTSEKPCPVAYCGAACYNVDYPVHVNSGECRILLLGGGDSEVGLRLTLRLLYRVPVLPATGHPGRLVGLITNQGGKVLDSHDSNLLLNVLGREEGSDDADLAHAFYAVTTNEVEVRFEDVQYGSAVYPPAFSWFNHSCSPEVIWRFDYHGDQGIEGPFLVSPYGGDEAIMQLWRSDFPEFVSYGPRVVIRTIQPLQSNQPVHLSYIDHLPHRNIRQEELEHESEFLCKCSRCESTEALVDKVLSEVFYPLCSEAGRGTFPWRSLKKKLSKAKILEDGLKLDDCMKTLDMIFMELFNYKRAPLVENTYTGHTLHPLHYQLFDAYGSMKRTSQECAKNKIESGDMIEGLRLRKVGAAFSLLSAGAFYHLFCMEPSFVNYLGLDWLEAGEFLLVLSENLNDVEPRDADGNNCFVCSHPKIPMFEAGPFLKSSSNITCQEFAACIGKLVTIVWPFLIMDVKCLQSINNPFDLKWLESPTLLARDESPGYDLRDSLKELALHCFGFGSHFLSIAYGSEYATLVRLRERLAEKGF